MKDLNDIVQGECDSSGESKEKRAYAKPYLTDYGSIVALTAGASGSGEDSANIGGCTGASGPPCHD